jgi:hypothetical protein
VIQPLGDPQGVLVLDETGFVKKGQHAAGVARPYRGPAGMSGPKERTDDRERCRRAHRVPEPAPGGQRITVAPWDGPQARRGDRPAAPAGWSPAGLPPVPSRGGRLREPPGNGAPHARLATTVARAPVQILPGGLHRGPRETTADEARAPLGRATPRQGHDRSVRRPPPAGLGRDAITTLAAAHRSGDPPAAVRTTAWEPTPPATGSEARACVRRSLWQADPVPLSGAPPEGGNIPRALVARLTAARCDAASLAKALMHRGDTATDDHGTSSGYEGTVLRDRRSRSTWCQKPERTPAREHQVGTTHGGPARGARRSDAFRGGLRRRPCTGASTGTSWRRAAAGARGLPPRSGLASVAQARNGFGPSRRGRRLAGHGLTGSWLRGARPSPWRGLASPGGRSARCGKPT